jgi:hypothetical protein
MIDDPRFYATAVVAVLILGIAKGGLAGGIGLVAVPLMSLTIEPARAAAILLPILMLMDVTALRPWWGKWDGHNLRTTAPGAVLGTRIVSKLDRLLSSTIPPARGIPEGFDTPFLLRRGSETHAESPIAPHKTLWASSTESVLRRVSMKRPLSGHVPSSCG